MNYLRISAALLALALGSVIPGQARAADKAAPVRVVALLTVDIQLAADGNAVNTTHAEIRAANSGAAMAIGQTSLPYNSSLQSLEIVAAHTLKKDGKTIPVNVSAIYDQLPPGAAQIPMFTDTRMKVIVFPQFSAGDTAVYTYRITTKHPIYAGQFWYADMYPRNAAFDDVRETLTAPKDMRLHIENHDVPFAKDEENGRAVYHWHYSAPQPADVKAAAVSPLSNVPRFFVSTFPDYATLGRTYAAAAAPQMTVTPAIQALADTITKDAGDQREQTRKLYEWVAAHIRYVAVELGRGTLVPHRAETVLTNGYGDCKDHVALLETLLKAKGIASEGVLINAGSDYELTDVPTFIGLDHIITYVPALNLYLDSTAIVAPFGTLPFQEYGKPVVYTSLTNPRRGTTPVLPPGLATMTTRTVSHLSKDGQLTGTTTTAATGPFEVMLRMAGLGIESLGADIAAKKLMSGLGYGNDVNGTLQAPPPNTPGQGYSISGSFSADGWSDALAGERSIPLFGGMRLLGFSGDGVMGQFGASSANSDFDYPCYSAQATEDMSLEAPGGIRFESVPQDTHVKTPNIQFDARWTLSGQTLSVHRAFVSLIDRPFCTADIRKAYAAALKEIADSYNTSISFEGPKGSGSSGLDATGGPVPSTAGGGLSPRDSKLAAMLDEAGAAYKKNQRTKALRILTKILGQPDLPLSASYPALSDRAMLYQMGGETDKALKDLNAILVLVPGDQRALAVRSQIYKIKGKGAAAMRDTDALIEKSPNDAFALVTRGDLFMNEKDYNNAIKDYSAALRIAPNDADTLELRGLAYQGSGHHEEAIADFRHAARLGNSDPDIQRYLCVSLSHLKKRDATLAHCSTVHTPHVR